MHFEWGGCRFFVVILANTSLFLIEPESSSVNSEHSMSLHRRRAKQDAINRAHWNAISDVHIACDFYPIEAVINGESTLTPLESEWLTSLSSLDGLHVQCGLGLETIALARLGARMTGIDYAERAIAAASVIAERAQTDINYNCANFLSFNPSLSGSYDFVYTSHGSLRWVSDIMLWMRNVSRYLRPRGRLFLFDIHPLAFRLERIVNEAFILTGEYFSTEGIEKLLRRTHAVDQVPFGSERVVHFDWPLYVIIQSLLDAGLVLCRFQELPACSYNRRNALHKIGPNEFRSPTEHVAIPMSFGLVAERPATVSDHV